MSHTFCRRTKKKLTRKYMKCAAEMRCSTTSPSLISFLHTMQMKPAPSISNRSPEPTKHCCVSFAMLLKRETSCVLQVVRNISYISALLMNILRDNDKFWTCESCSSWFINAFAGMHGFMQMLQWSKRGNSAEREYTFPIVPLSRGIVCCNNCVIICSY